MNAINEMEIRLEDIDLEKVDKEIEDEERHADERYNNFDSGMAFRKEDETDVSIPSE